MRTEDREQDVSETVESLNPLFQIVHQKTGLDLKPYKDKFLRRRLAVRLRATRYRRLAAAQLGPSCSTGLFAPDADELTQTLTDWLNQFERIQLMLRLSTRLRQKHND